MGDPDEAPGEIPNRWRQQRWNSNLWFPRQTLSSPGLCFEMKTNDINRGQEPLWYATNKTKMLKEALSSIKQTFLLFELSEWGWEWIFVSFVQFGHIEIDHWVYLQGYMSLFMDSITVSVLLRRETCTYTEYLHSIQIYKVFKYPSCQI